MSAWSSWLDAGKWQEFAEKTKQEAIKLAEEASVKAAELSKQAAEVASDLSADISKQAADIKTKMENEGISTSFLNSLHLSGNGGEEKREPGEIDLIYVTQNILSMSKPIDYKKERSKSGKNDNNILDIAAYLESNHKGHFMILNISEESYDYSLFDNQVLEYSFPGHPAPPLGVLFKICMAVESWLDADSRNVVVVHCITGKGRTGTLIACIMAWLGEFASPMEALHYISNRRRIPVDVLTIPSQRRYIQYFGNMIDGVKPRSEAVVLSRIVMNTVPKFERKLAGKPDEGQAGDKILEGCCPYIQLFKCGKLIATSTALRGNDDKLVETKNNEKYTTASLQLTWISSEDGSALFDFEVPVRGDILLRCRHADSTGSRVSMFRAAFHSGYVPSGPYRLTKQQLDGADTDDRFNEEFFIDLIFSANVNPSRKGADLTPAENTSTKAVETESENEFSQIYESTLHRDTRFWEGIANRKSRVKRRKQRKFDSDGHSASEKFSIDTSIAQVGGDIIEFDTEMELPPEKKMDVHDFASDNDLIAQLAYAEKLLGNEGAVEEGQKSSGMSSASNELKALEDLERELGLGDLNLFGDKAASESNSLVDVKASLSDSNSYVLEDNEDESLEELERYLQSINGPLK